MDDAVLVGMLSCVRDGGDNLNGVHRRDYPRAAQFGQVASVDEVQHHEITTVGHASEAMHPHNIRMVEASNHAGLFHETFHQVRPPH